MPINPIGPAGTGTSSLKNGAVGGSSTANSNTLSSTKPQKPKMALKPLQNKPKPLQPLKAMKPSMPKPITPGNAMRQQAGMVQKSAWGVVHKGNPDGMDMMSHCVKGKRGKRLKLKPQSVTGT